jgi:protein-disulfide isomerase
VLVGVLVVGFLVLQNRAPTTIAEPAKTTSPTLARGRTLGVAAAPVKLDVWSDFQCPGCLQFWTSIEPNIVSTFVASGQVQLVYHDFTFIGPESLAAAVGANCADKQGKFWPYHDLLYANQGNENSGAFSQDRLASMAVQAGLDSTAWTTCIADPAVSQAVKDETAAGQKAGVKGTPTLFVNGTNLPSFGYEVVSAAIRTALAAASPGGSPSASATASP